MNHQPSSRPHPIDLAVEAPFRLLGLEVTPAALEIRHDGKVTAIEPRVMQVFVALHRAANHVVSRDELLDLCWEGRIVGDDSLNRSVSQLRKALAPEGDVSVDTIPRIGYRLSFEPPEPAAAPKTSLTARGLSRRLFLISACVVLAILAAILLATSRPAPRSWTASGVRPLTQEAGIEMQPALSPDGITAAYTAGPGFWAPRDIYLRSVSVGDGSPIRLTDTPDADESAPAWNARGDRLAFLRERTGGPCEIVVVTPPNGAQRVVGQCRSPSSGLAWLSNRELVLGNRPAGTRARRLIALDVATGISRALTTPPVSSLGDTAPAVSNDGRRVAFRRTAALGSDAIYLLDTQTGEQRRLTDGGWKAAGFAWANDHRTLFFSSNRGGDFGLWPSIRERIQPRSVSLWACCRLASYRQTAAAATSRSRPDASKLISPPFPAKARPPPSRTVRV